MQAAVDRAHEEAAWWGALSFDEREKHLQTWKGAMTRRIAQLAEVMHQETGKPHGDAMLESALAIDHLAWAASHAEKVLKRRKVPSGLVMANQAAYVEYQPLGVIGVIGPWNYPVFTPMGSIGYALAAGNAVVFKPSEYTPGVGEWLARTFLESVGRPVLQVVTGFGETGHALCTAGVNKVAFTGSTATGKKVMAACAETLTPVVIEAGGKDALLVDEDADLEAAADAAIWGACSNAGQTCTGVERVYVHERVYDEFLADADRQGAGGDCATTAPTPRSGRSRCPGSWTSSSGTSTTRSPVAAAPWSAAPTPWASGSCSRPSWSTYRRTRRRSRRRRSGPTVTVAKVRDMDEAIERTNATRYGLGSTVFSKARGMELASRIRSGMTAVNGVITFAAIPSLPFGGVGDSGFGRIHGPDGLKEFTFAKAIARQRFKPLLALTTFGRTEKADTAARLDDHDAARPGDDDPQAALTRHCRPLERVSGGQRSA